MFEGEKCVNIATDRTTALIKIKIVILFKGLNII